MNIKYILVVAMAVMLCTANADAGCAQAGGIYNGMTQGQVKTVCTEISGNAVAAVAVATFDSFTIKVGYTDSCSATSDNINAQITSSNAGSYEKEFKIPDGSKGAISFTCTDADGCDATVSGTICNNSNIIKGSIVLIAFGALVSLLF